jgi:iron complex outermembrane receptor protein
MGKVEASRALACGLRIGASALALAVGASPVAAQVTGAQSSNSADPGGVAAQTGPGAQQPTEAQAQARNAAATDDNGVPEIVVTAQFREQNLQDVPIAISAVNAEALLQRTTTDLTDVARAVPNVEMTAGNSGFGANTNQAFVRGLGQADFLTTFEPRVGFYIDDVYFATTFGAVFDVLDLERVEVLRGPQGTLFGRNSVGGAIRIISKKPQGDNSGYLEVTGGRFSRYQVRGAYDFALVPDQLMARITASTRGQDGWVKLLDYKCVNPSLGNQNVSRLGQGPANGGSCKRGTLGGTRNYNFRGSLRWVASDAIEVLAQADYVNEDSESAPEAILKTSTSLINPETGISGGGPSTPGANPAIDNGLGRYLRAPNTVFNRTTGAALAPGLGSSYYGFNTSTPALLQQVAQSFVSPTKYSSYASYGNPRLGYVNPPEGNLESYGGSLTVDIDLAEKLHLTSITAYRKYEGDFGQSLLAIPVEEVRNLVKNRQFTQEVRLLGSVFEDLVDFTVGGFYINSRSRNAARVQTEGFTNPLDFLGNDPGTLKSYAFYGAVDIHPIERLTISGGLRYSNEKKTYVFDRDYSPSNLSVLNAVLPGANKDTRFNPRVAVQYEFTDTVNLYASYATGFTASAFNARPFNAAGVYGLDPEKVQSYEVGLKTSLFDRMLTLNSAAYFTKFDRLIGTVQNAAYAPAGPSSVGACAIFCNDNVGNAEIKGFEVEAQARPTRNLLISGNVGYTDFQYKELLAITQGLTLDSPNTRVPKWNLSGSIQYTAELGNGDKIIPRFDVSYRSRIYYSADLRNRAAQQSPFALANARLTYQNTANDWSLSVAVTNVFDKLYYTTLTDQLNSFGFLSGTLGRPREWLVTARKNF